MRLWQRFVIMGLVVFLCRALFLGVYPDFEIWYRGVKTFWQGGNPYQIIAGVNDVFLWPPGAFILLVPITLLPLKFAAIFWVGLSIISYLVCLMLVARKNFWFWILALNFFPAKFTLGMGQVNIFLLLMLIAAYKLILRKNTWLVGIILGLCIGLKFYPILFLGYLIFRRQWKILGGFFLTLLLFELVFYFVGKDWVVGYYLNQTLKGMVVSQKLSYFNQSLSGGLGRLGLNLGVMIFSLVLVGKYFLTRMSIVMALGVGIVSQLIVSPFSWQHHFVLMILPLGLIWKKSPIISFICMLFMGINLALPETWPVILQNHVLWGALGLQLLGYYAHSR